MIRARFGVGRRLRHRGRPHVEVRDSGGELRRLVTQDAEFSPPDPAQLVERSIEDAEIDEQSGEPRCRLSDGSALAITPAAAEAQDDRSYWELRGYPQYFEFDELLRPRKNQRGEAQQLTNRTSALPLVLVDGGPWGFGGRVLPDAQVAASERAAVREFAELAQKKQLTLEPDKEQNAR